MDRCIIEKIRDIKNHYEKQGFIILGIFGSYSRSEESKDSDIDILYELNEDFYRTYPGWDMIPVIEEVETRCKNELGIKPDLVNKNALNDIAKKYILPEVVYV